ncbi:hypothetical protein AB0L68_31925 [Streptomyces sp. NPDC052164]|uniref:hypothetical protein n=1 Tax=Streptomyces sp. NPDC052164 TaxID=3155529 RepID=UPI00342AA1AC
MDDEARWATAPLLHDDTIMSCRRAALGTAAIDVPPDRRKLRKTLTIRLGDHWNGVVAELVDIWCGRVVDARRGDMRVRRVRARSPTSSEPPVRPGRH